MNKQHIIPRVHLEDRKGEQHPPQNLGEEDEKANLFGPKDRTDEERPATHGSPQRTKQRIFARAQRKVSTSPPAPYASVEHRTTFGFAKQRDDGMESRPSTVETQTSASSTVKATSSVRIGSVPRVVPARDTATNVQVAEVQLMAPRNARSHNPEVATPLRREGWSRLLIKHDLLTKYPNLPQYIQHGANAGIPKITQTYIPPNCPSVHAHSSAFKEIITREFNKGRYSGPFTQTEVEDRIGPFQTSPLSMVPKAGKPGKFRLIQNLSFPRHNPAILSINHALDSDDFPCTWGTFFTICTLVDNLPPGSQGACRDVAEAYRIIPLAKDQWPGLAVRLSKPDEFAINKCNSFGCATAGGLYGLFADALADIFRAEGIGPTSKWVDDQIFLRILRIHLEGYNRSRAVLQKVIWEAGGWKQQGGRLWTGRGRMSDGRSEEFDEDMAFPIQDLAADRDHGYTYDMSDIDRISYELGIPWEQSKDVDFGTSFPFIGFNWNIEKKVVSLRPEKKEKYILAIKEWRKSRVHTLAEAQKLYGKLLHATLAHPDGRPYLASLEAMLGIFHNNPHLPRTPPRQVPADLDWWITELAKPTIGRSIPTAHEVHDISAFSDASSSTGIAIVIGTRWRAWKLTPGWNADQRDIGWAEAVGFEFLARTVTHLNQIGREKHFEVYGDNQGVVEGWKRGRSRNPRVNEVFKRITKLSRDTGIIIHTRYVRSAKNPADDPSRGRYPPISLLLPPLSIPHELKEFIIDYDHPTDDRKLSDDQPHTAVHTVPKTKPSAVERAKRGREDNDLDATARHLYQAKTTFQWD